MITLPKLAPAPIRGPRAIPFLGATGSLIRFFAEPVGALLSLKREFGDIAALGDRDPALIAAFGAAHNRQILSDSSLFYNSAEAPFRLPKGSAAEHLNTALTAMNGEEQIGRA